ncbi:rhomboid family intramembrane serine protease [Tenacibaculum singaporense]|uniref:Rhomboid family intramembrane serine protease n=1 Tax=Tenacibaculum singaporense TaxID=2358479 RepID=A0A3Q8RRT3_9FLAO|nr:rhomboid family intramembrane serine protease [Tenacibaculum singaporense]AZJ36575.1 rhomboid family intramembrane serine protease [Tenacibaculum singaporense]
MNTDEQLKFSRTVFTIPLLFVFTIWFVYWLEIKFGWNFNKFGVFPRSFSGLKGVLCSPFIHSDTNHLFNNSVPLFVLSACLFYFYKEVAVKVLIYGGIVTGLLTWIIARESYHIGASGVVYLLFSFVLFSGIIKKNYRLVAVSFITIFLYGSMVWYVLPIKEGMSWEGHLSGLVTGFVLSLLYRKRGIVKEKFEFSKTEFDDMFDEDGNYAPPVFEEEMELEELEEIKYRYIYKEEE